MNLIKELRSFLLLVIATTGLIVSYTPVVHAQGSIYGPTTFFDDVSVGIWGGVTNVATSTTNGGAFTTGIVNTIDYQIGGTNLSGRLPWITNTVIFTGHALTNAVVLSWDRYDGLKRIVIRRTVNAGAPGFIALPASTTTFTDLNNLTFATTPEINDYNEIPDPIVPWYTNLFAGVGTTGVITSVGADAGKFLKADGTFDVPDGNGLTTNASPNMADGTIWTFANASVTNDADTGQEIVSYQVATNLIAASISTPTSLVYSTGQEMISGTDGQVEDTAGNPVMVFNTRTLQDSGGTATYTWNTRTFLNTAGGPMINHQATNYVGFLTNVYFGATPATASGYIHAGVTGPIEIRANDTLELVATNGINVNSDTTVNANLGITGQVYNVGINEITYIGTNVTWDADNGNMQFLVLTNDVDIALPSNIQPGATYMLLVQQDGTGSRLAVWDTGFDWGDGESPPTLTITAGKEDVITSIARGAAKFYAVPTIKGFTP